MRADLARSDDAAKAAKAFVEKVSLATAWRNGSPRYLACLVELTVALPQDGQTYATSLTLREPPRPAASAGAAKAAIDNTLQGRLECKTPDQNGVQRVLDKVKALPDFQNVKPGASQPTGNARDREVSFSISFTYVPAKPAAAAPAR